MGFKRKLPPNIPGEPIVNRDAGATSYCVACHETYQNCTCRVYMSADTLKRDTHPVEARDEASQDI